MMTSDNNSLSQNKNRVADGFPGERHIIIPSEVLDRANSLPVSRALFPTNIGHFKNAARHYIRRETGIPQHLVIICLSGSGICEIDSQQWNLKENEVIFLPADVPHHYKADVKSPWTIFWFHYQGLQCLDYLNTLGVSQEDPIIYTSNISSLVSAFEAIYQHTQDGYTDTSIFCLSTSLSQFFGSCRYHKRAMKIPRRRTEEKILLTIEFMKDNLHRSLSLTNLAEISCLSAQHYSQVFRQQINSSPMEFYTRLKIQHACHMLKITNNSIAEISAALGYTEPFYFSKVFNKKMQLSPSEYRKKFQLLPAYLTEF